MVCLTASTADCEDWSISEQSVFQAAVRCAILKIGKLLVYKTLSSRSRSGLLTHQPLSAMADISYTSWEIALRCRIVLAVISRSARDIISYRPRNLFQMSLIQKLSRGTHRRLRTHGTRHTQRWRGGGEVPVEGREFGRSHAGKIEEISEAKSARWRLPLWAGDVDTLFRRFREKMMIINHRTCRRRPHRPLYTITITITTRARI